MTHLFVIWRLFHLSSIWCVDANMKLQIHRSIHIFFCLQSNTSMTYTFVTWLIPFNDRQYVMVGICDMTYPYVTWLIHMWHMYTPIGVWLIYLWHESFVFDKTHFFLWQAVRDLTNETYDMTKETYDMIKQTFDRQYVMVRVFDITLLYVTCLIDMCNDSFLCDVTHLCDITHSHATLLIHMWHVLATRDMIYSYHHSFIRDILMSRWEGTSYVYIYIYIYIDEKGQVKKCVLFIRMYHPSLYICRVWMSDDAYEWITHTPFGVQVERVHATFFN